MRRRNADDADGDIVVSAAPFRRLNQTYADQENDAPDALRNAIEQASNQIYETSISDEKYFGMGTTVIALVLLNDRAFSAHVGDSRLYRRRENTRSFNRTSAITVVPIPKYFSSEIDVS